MWGEEKKKLFAVTDMQTVDSRLICMLFFQLLNLISLSKLHIIYAIEIT